MLVVTRGDFEVFAVWNMPLRHWVIADVSRHHNVSHSGEQNIQEEWRNSFFLSRYIAAWISLIIFYRCKFVGNTTQHVKNVSFQILISHLLL